MLQIDHQLKAEDLKTGIEKFWKISGQKILSIDKKSDRLTRTPVFTVKGNYTNRGWTEWTKGFLIGSSILQFDATGEGLFLDSGKRQTRKEMAEHVSHMGVHDHGFNNISTYGNLLRLMKEGKIPVEEYEKDFYELALKLSGAVQASRWTKTEDGGYIYSFNGPHSLFVDTIRSCRVLMISHTLGHRLYGENDQKISLLERALLHLKSTADYSVYYGEKRDMYDVRGRVAHESIFDINNGRYRCPNSQQGYSPFTTWTRGLAWAMLGFSEELEFIKTLPQHELSAIGGKEKVEQILLKAASATCDFYITHSPTDGIPYWDTGAPELSQMPDYLNQPADPFNNHEPVDSSAATIGAQGLLRFGHYLQMRDEEDKAKKYWQAGLTVTKTLLHEPYLSTDPAHQGLILHSVYHRPNGWDYIPPGSNIPNGESGIWGDYHARELMLFLLKIINKDPYYSFFNCVS